MPKLPSPRPAVARLVPPQLLPVFRALSTLPLTSIAAAAGADPQGSGPIVAALAWVQGTLLGNVATAVAVIAVATVGFMMLTGRIHWRFGATVVLGCFILFGSAAIVTGIQGAASAAR